MVNLGFPIETTSLRGLAVLFWPKNGVALTTVAELVAIDAILTSNLELEVEAD